MVDFWRNLPVLVVGAGSIGRRHCRILKELGVKHIAACDTDPGKRDALRRNEGIQNIYEDFSLALQSNISAVFICTPPELHIPQARAAIEAGCHVFTEKPLSDSLDGVHELIALAHKRKKSCMVGLCFRFHEGLTLVKKYLDEGRIGRLISIRAVTGEYLPDVRPDYKTLFVAEKIGVFDIMHEIDLAYWFAGSSPRRITAMAGTYSDIGIKAYDIAEILIEFDESVLASIHLDFFQRVRRRQIELLGSQGTAIVEFASWDKCTVSLYTTESKKWQHTALSTRRDDMFRLEDRMFLEAITEHSPVPIDASVAKVSVALVLAAQQAIVNGRTQDVP